MLPAILDTVFVDFRDSHEALRDHTVLKLATMAVSKLKVGPAAGAARTHPSARARSRPHSLSLACSTTWARWCPASWTPRSSRASP